MNTTGSNKDTLEKYTHGRLLMKNTFLNIFGLLAPLLAALYAVPIVIQSVGTDRFGLLTIAWAVVGYFSLFDLGLSRAVIQMVAEKLGAGRDREIPGIVWTALFAMVGLGLVGSVTAILMVPYLVRDILQCPAELTRETLYSFYCISASLPFVIIRSGFRGILIAHQRFDLTNLVRIPLGIYTFLAPLAVLPFSRSLFPIVLVLLAGLLVACAVYFLLCLRIVPNLKKQVVLEKNRIGPLFRFGGWMTVTNVIGPIMVYMDRFFIGAVVSLTAVAFYATPHEIVTKVILIPSALTGVLFPAFSTSHAADRKRLTELYHQGVKAVFLVVFPVILVLVTFSRQGLTFWLDESFAASSYRILQILSAGVLLNCLAMVPFSLIQGVGRPDLTAKIHLMELPVYLFCLWWLIPLYGAEGAAMVWSGRVALDTALLFVLSSRFLQLRAEERISLLVPVMFGAGAMLLAGILTQTVMAKMMLLLVFFICFPVVTWSYLLRAPEKEMLRQRLVRMRNK